MLNKLTAKLFGKLSIIKQQYLLLLFVMSTLGLIVYIIMQNINNNPMLIKKRQVEEVPQETTKKMDTALDAIDSGELWRYKQKKESDETKVEIGTVRDILGKHMQEHERVVNANEIEQLKEQVAILQEQIVMQGQNRAAISPEESQKGEGVGIRKIKIELESQNSEAKKVHTIESTIPAGAFAKAVILGGVDASTSIMSPGDPRPLLLRIDDSGTLPRRFHSDLEECHIVASGYGDLSSERVFTRLEKLTCIDRKTKEIVETEVAGYIAGEDGRAGLKGHVIEKTRGYIGKSIIGGILQGVSGIMTPGQDVTANAAGILTPKKGAGFKFREGFGQGMQGSMEKLSKYYIDRAESISPVIQIGAGRVVDVVFTEGAEIGSKRVKKQIEKRRIKEENIENNNGEIYEQD